MILEQMRKVKDRKGGDLMTVHQQNKDISLEKVITKKKTLFVKGNIRGLDIRLIAVYFSVKQ